MEQFTLEDLSRWYLKKVRERVKNGDKAANWTLENVLNDLTVMFSPFTPHIAEKVYEDLEGEKFSVHAEEYPEPEEEWIEEGLEDYMDVAREIVEASVKVRDENQYNLRWPAKRLVISTDEETEEGLQEFKGLTEDMANVNKVKFGEVASELVAKPDYSSLGPKFGGDADEVASKIEDLEHSQIEQLQELGELELKEHQIKKKDVEIESRTKGEVSAKGFSEGEVFLDLEMDQEIENGAYVSEAIRAVQEARKQADLDVEDRVKLAFGGNTECLKDSRERIKSRINVSELKFDGEELVHSGKLEFKGRKLEFSFSDPVG